MAEDNGMASPSGGTKGFRFLALPPGMPQPSYCQPATLTIILELRNRVYHFCRERWEYNLFHMPTKAPHMCRGPAYFMSRFYWSTPPREFFGLTQVSRLVRFEYRDMYLSAANVRIRHDQAERYIATFLPPPSSPEARKVQGNVAIHVNVRGLQQLELLPLIKAIYTYENVHWRLWGLGVIGNSLKHLPRNRNRMWRDFIMKRGASLLCHGNGIITPQYMLLFKPEFRRSWMTTFGHWADSKPEAMDIVVDMALFPYPDFVSGIMVGIYDVECTPWHIHDFFETRLSIRIGMEPQWFY